MSRFEGCVGRLSYPYLLDKSENLKFTNKNMQVKETLISLSILLDYLLSMTLEV